MERIFKNDKRIISMEQPLVSVITITRNRGNLIGRCIKSVLGQTYTNIEYIIVDGASEDNTDEVIASFKDDRLHYVKLDTNWPIKETLDHGISLCKGKYITFLDSDDEYLPEKIEKQVRKIESLHEEYGLVYCWMTFYDNQSKKVLKIQKPELRGDVRDEVIGGPILSGTPTLMFREELLRKLGGWKSMEELGIVSDWELCVRACQITKVDYVAESLVNVYENHESVRQSDEKYYSKYYERCIKCHSYFLNTYASAIERKPELGFYHYWVLFVSYIRLNRYGKSLYNMVKAFKSSPRYFVKKLING